MKSTRESPDRLVLEAQSRQDRTELNRLQEEMKPLPRFHWFKGAVDVKLLRKLKQLGAIS